MGRTEMAVRSTLIGRLIPGQLSAMGTLRRMLADLCAQRLLLALIGCYMASGLVTSLLIPPWQSPDEPTHFEYARGLAIGTTVETPAIQGPIIASFYRYRFWDYRGVRIPNPSPASFGELKRLLLRQTDKTPLYYWLAAAVSGWTNDVTLQLYSMRWLSVLLSALTIPIVYFIAREILPEARAPLALAAAALVAFLPMYGYIGASVNPDTIGAPLGAATIWLAVRGLRGKQPAVSLVCALLCALLTFWVRRSAIALIPWALLVAGASLVGQAWRRLPRAWVVATSVSVVAATLVVMAWPSSSAAAWEPLGAQLGPTRSDRYAYAGAYSLRLAHQGQTPPAALLQVLSAPQLRMLANHEVMINAAVRSGGATVPGRLVFRVQTTSVRDASVAFLATSEWQPIALRTSLPASPISADLTIALDGDGELYTDQVQLLDAATGSPLATSSNGGGEEALLWWQTHFTGNRVAQYLSRILQSARDGVYLSPAALALYPYFLAQMFDSLIGRFGWMSIYSNRVLIGGMGIIWVVLLIALIGVRRRASGFDAGRRHALAWMFLLVVLTLVAIFLEYTSYLNLRIYPQGRYLFPILAAIITLLVSGLAQLLPARHDRASAAILVLLFLAFDLWSWGGVIVPFFYG